MTGNKVKYLDGRGAVTILHCYASLGLRPPEAVLWGIAERIEDMADTLSAQDVSMLWWALAKFHFNPDQLTTPLLAHTKVPPPAVQECALSTTTGVRSLRVNDDTAGTRHGHVLTSRHFSP